MSFLRNQVSSTKELVRPARQGDGMLSHFSPAVVATDANATMTVTQMSGGFVQYTGFTAGRTITTPTAALFLAANPDMDIGDSYSFIVSTINAFAVTWAAGAGVTISGRTTVPASSYSLVIVTRTGAATVEWRTA